MLHLLGWDTGFEDQFAKYQEKNLSPARVIRRGNQSYTIFDGKRSLQAKITGKFRHHSNVSKDYPAVGDWIVYETKAHSEIATIHAVLPRKSYFSRKLPISGGRKFKKGVLEGGSTEEQVIAANIDVVLIVSGLDGNFDVRRIERFLTLTYNSGAAPVIVLNKMDLCNKIDEYVEQVRQIAINVPTLVISVEKNKNMDSLLPYLTSGKTIALLGSSGVGKSTLTNYLMGEERQVKQPTSKASGKGKHTTTSAELILHQSGYMIIDTPGLREVQLWGDEEVLKETFQDVTVLFKRCRYSNCRHQTEPGCAIKQAIEDGVLSQSRYESYLKQYDELFRLNRKKKKLDIQLNKKLKQRKNN
ncbi:ribosome small subunit-dependent GTPase A [Peribacillus deserti]|uniref:Small ribosomal subunit biogenesis GTPase RsgA n=1 Tax=Peribacillus deserti TaxID=673318 RepID=A0A2N5M9Y6_9BACI|nr:ribosome small subunit-dependent GTPase A [Peribacillus deserti]PLT31125.1 ribosome small subunit-dependent GTPase A [Peribacillus deserti]